MFEIHLYRLWYGNENSRSEIARFRAEDLENVSDYVRKEFIAPEAEITHEDGDEMTLYLSFDVCKACERKNDDDFTEEECEMCETAEWLQIEQYDEIEAKFDTIYGTSDFYDLTKPEGEEKTPNWAPELHKAWLKDPQDGAEASIAKLVEDNPELAIGIDSELLKRGKAALRPIRDKNGQTAEEWGKELFEFELCGECGKDWNEHDYTLLLGGWFAKCRSNGEEQ